MKINDFLFCIKYLNDDICKEYYLNMKIELLPKQLISKFKLMNISIGMLLSFICFLLTPTQSYSKDIDLHSVSMRARISEHTVLGKDAPEVFEEYDVTANFGLPWQSYSRSGWGMGTRLMASGGILRGAGKDAFVLSLIPELTFGSGDGRFTLDLGIGGALFSRSRFGIQDYGGPFQFALTLGSSFPIYKKLGLGYRFLHYSDAGLNGPHTIGADFHMIEFNYRL